MGGNRSDTKGSCRLHTPFSHVYAHTCACVQLTLEQHGLQLHRSTYRWISLTRRVGQEHVICGGLNLRMQNVRDREPTVCYARISDMGAGSVSAPNSCIVQGSSVCVCVCVCARIKSN